MACEGHNPTYLLTYCPISNQTYANISLWPPSLACSFTLVFTCEQGWKWIFFYDSLLPVVQQTSLRFTLVSYGWVRYRRTFSHLKLRTFLLLLGDCLEGAVWNRPVHTVKTMGVLWNPRRQRSQEWQKRSVDSTYDGWWWWWEGGDRVPTVSPW